MDPTPLLERLRLCRFIEPETPDVCVTIHVTNDKVSQIDFKSSSDLDVKSQTAGSCIEVKMNANIWLPIINWSQSVNRSLVIGVRKTDHTVPMVVWVERDQLVACTVGKYRTECVSVLVLRVA